MDAGYKHLALRCLQPSEVRGRGVEPLRLAAAEPKAEEPREDSRDIEKTSPPENTRRPEMTHLGQGEGQSRGDAAAVLVTDVELERAIVDAVTMGLPDVARVLALQLSERVRARLGSAVDISERRHRK